MDGLVIVHPVWWFAPPAILKGWVDQVLVDTVAIKQLPEGSPRPLLNGRWALLIQTFNVPRWIDRGPMRRLAEQFWRRAVFLPVGIRRVQRVALHGVDDIGDRKLAAAERKIARAVDKLF
jgi:putative NADPH-quinone reductase